MTRKRFSFDIETRCGLGVAAHAAMCADATLTPDQAIDIARHEMMDIYDQQTLVYAGAAGLDTVTVIGDSHIGEPCKYLGMDCGVGRDVIIVHGGDLLEPAMFKSLDKRVLIRQIVDEPTRVRPAREPKKRDWEQRNRKQRRR